MKGFCKSMNDILAHTQIDWVNHPNVMCSVNTFVWAKIGARCRSIRCGHSLRLPMAWSSYPPIQTQDICPWRGRYELHQKNAIQSYLMEWTVCFEFQTKTIHNKYWSEFPLVQWIRASRAALTRSDQQESISIAGGHHWTMKSRSATVLRIGHCNSAIRK